MDSLMRRNNRKSKNELMGIISLVGICEIMFEILLKPFKKTKKKTTVYVAIKKR